MGGGKINLFEMGELIRAGKKTKEIACYFQCSERAVQKRQRRLELDIAKNAALHQSGVILKQDLDAREQMLKINASANRVLDLLEAQLRQDQEKAVGQMTGKLLGLKGRLAGGNGEVEELIEELEALVVTRPATIEQLFKAQAEIRQQVALVLKVAAELLEASRVNEIHRILVEEIGAESSECRGRIVRRLQSTNLLLTATGFA
jgi:predicted component of type VI protein secretion system